MSLDYEHTTCAKSFPEVNIGADKCKFDCTIRCLVCMAKKISQNLQPMDVNRGWFEDQDTAAINKITAPVSFHHITPVPNADLQQTIFAIHRTFSKEAKMRAELKTK